MSNIKFNSVLIVGVGLIGSSIARAIKEYNISQNIYGYDNNSENLKKCKDLKILTKGEKNFNNLNQQFELIIICSPLSSYKNIFQKLNSYILQDTIITDVGSTKVSVISDFNEIITNKYIKFVPSHPIAVLKKVDLNLVLQNFLKIVFVLLRL